MIKIIAIQRFIIYYAGAIYTRLNNIIEDFRRWSVLYLW